MRQVGLQQCNVLHNSDIEEAPKHRRIGCDLCKIRVKHLSDGGAVFWYYPSQQLGQN